MILPWDKLVELALGGYHTILDELYRSFRDSTKFPDPLRYITGETSDFSSAFADLLADMGMTAEVNGMADPIASLSMQNLPILKDWREQYYDNISRYPKTWLWDGITFPSETPVWRPVTEKAVKALKSWKTVTRSDFDKMRRIEKSRAWTITKINNVKTLKHLKTTLQESIQSGDGSKSWYSDVKKDFEKSRLGPAAAELVFRVAATKGWHEGQARILEEKPIGELFPYVNVITINDSRRSQACYMMSYSGLDKTSVYNRRDPAYLKNRTPRHYNCRCRDSFMTVAQAARAGVQEAQEWLKTGKRPDKFEMVPYFEVPMPKGWIPLSLSLKA
jgi:hypothetical protein